MERLLRFFEYEHLPADLQRASQPFCELARQVVKDWPENAERTVTLRKLLEAKDAAVRSVLEGATPTAPGAPFAGHEALTIHPRILPNPAASASAAAAADEKTTREVYGAGKFEVSDADHVAD